MAMFTTIRIDNDGIELFEKAINNRSYALNYYYRESVKAQKAGGQTVSITATHADAQAILSFAIDNPDSLTTANGFPKGKETQPALIKARKAIAAYRKVLASATYSGTKPVEPFNTTFAVPKTATVKPAAKPKAKAKAKAKPKAKAPVTAPVTAPVPAPVTVPVPVTANDIAQAKG